MQQLMTVDNSTAPTMSSREIADLTGRRHDQVLRTARDLVAQGVTQSVETLYRHEQNGQQYPEHRLDRRDSMVLVARLSPEFTARVVDRWQELEQQVSNSYQLPDFNNPAAAARAWADQVEQNQQLALEHDRLTAEVSHLQAHFTDGMKITDFARTLNGVNCQQVQNRLAELGWIRRDGFGWRVNSQYRDRYLAERPRTWVHPVTEERQESKFPVLLKKGAVRLFQLYTGGQLPMKANWNGKYGHGSEVMQ
ncbi:Rha family transcriptional regulator [Marinobacterium stanieri]|uniref:Rha family transcriptional regulator n=1 Tax=Marinobacterium stanieri TaxID=49186 RepID=UPI0002557829|nr:Rha family transcriptional regulator [Marinobacterium stanieri]